MLHNFPIPYPDELFYSLCARYSLRMGYPDAKTFTLKVLGSRNALAVVDLPTHLAHVHDKVPSGLFASARDIINKHTLLPFYRPFMAAEHAEKLEAAMLGSDDVHFSSGVVASTVKTPTRLRYCPYCTEEDNLKLGEPYWRRAHQLPGINICPNHEVMLQDSQVITSNRRNRHVFWAAREVVERKDFSPTRLDPRSHDLLVGLAKDASWLLRQTIKTVDLTEFREKYRRALAEKGYATYAGRVRVSKLIEAFRNFYGGLLECPLPEATQHTWLHRIVRHPKSSHHPLRHLLLMRFLEYSPQSFFSYVPQGIFGAGPWPCLNCTSDHFQKDTVKSIVVHHTKDKGQPVGTFECLLCGFTYQRTGPDRDAKDRHRIDRMIDFGPVWKDALSRYKCAGVGLREKARCLGVTTRTVTRYEAGMKVKVDGSVETSNSTREEMQAAWVALHQVHPSAGTTELRALSPHLYTWLYRHDRTWLRDFAKKHPAHTKTSRYHRVDWQERDEHLSLQVNAAVERLRSGEGKQIRLTVTSLARELGQVALIQKHARKLPKTLEVIRGNVETREDFALRRISWAARGWQKKQCPKRWQLERMAGLRPDLVALPSVQQALNEALTKLVVPTLERSNV